MPNSEKDVNTTDNVQTSLAILKGNIGPGCLALPWAFSLLGIPLGCLITVAMTATVTWNAWTLVDLKRRMWSSDARSVTYSDVGERLCGAGFRIVVDLSVIVVQLAVCTVFISNMGENLSAALRQTFSPSGGVVGLLCGKNFVMAALLPPILLLSSVPNLRRLAPSVALAAALMAASLTLVGVVAAHNWTAGLAAWRSAHGAASDYVREVQWRSAPLATCAIMYSLEGDQLILPIEGSMARPRDFRAVLAASMTIVGLLFCVFASVCTVAFGRVDGGSVTAFLMDRQDALAGSPYSTLLLANVVVSLSLLFTYPLQLYPAIGLAGQIVARRAGSSRGEAAAGPHDETTALWHADRSPTAEPRAALGGPTAVDVSMEGDSLALRACLVLVTFAVAVAVPHLKALISLAGAVTGSATSLIIPPMLALKFMERQEDRCDGGVGGSVPKRRLWRLFYRCLIVIGWIYGIIGTISSIQDIISIYAE